MQTPPFLEFCISALIIEAVCQRHSLPLCTLQSSARLCATCLMFLERSDCTQKVVTQCFFAYCLSTNICTLHLTPYEVCTPVELLSLGHWFICGGWSPWCRERITPVSVRALSVSVLRKSKWHLLFRSQESSNSSYPLIKEDLSSVAFHRTYHR